MEDNVLLRHMGDLGRKASKSGFSASRFLTPAQITAIKSVFPGGLDEAPEFDGGYDGAERCLAVFRAGWLDEDSSPPISALRVEYRKSDSLTHRDMLGALMSLGLEREVIGDIICPGEPPAYILCLASMSGFISENLIKIGGIGVSLSEVSLDKLPSKKQEYLLRKDTVASLRLDSVLASAFGVSRAEAISLISAGRVSLNHRECDTPSKPLREEDLISVRGMGRAKLLSAGGVSKKGRIWIETGKYI